MVEKHGENPCTYPPHNPRLWLEVEATDGQYMNWVSGMPMVLAYEMRLGRSASNLHIE
jgi:hypothetical protein